MKRLPGDMLAGLRLIAVLAVILLGGGLVILLSLLPGNSRNRRLTTWSLQRAVQLLLTAFGVSVQCNAPEQLRAHRGIVICNHQSFLDPCVLMSLALVRFVAYRHVMELPILGRITQIINTIYLDRESVGSRVAVRREIARQLREQPWPAIVIYPEGTTNSGNERLLPFYRGAFELSASEALPLLPCTLRFVPYAPFEWWREDATYAQALWQLVRYHGRKRAVLTVHEPVRIARNADTRAVADEIRGQMIAALSQTATP